MILSRLTIGCGILGAIGLIATSVLSSGPALAVSDGYEVKTEEQVYCTLFDNPEAFARFTEAYNKIKRATGRDPSVYEAKAAAGLTKGFCATDA